MVSIFYFGLILSGIAVKGLFDIFQSKIQFPSLAATQLLIGYERHFLINYPVVIDMEITPHLFVCGLSGSGKTCMIEYAIKGKDIVLINAFKKDFKSIKARRVNGNEKILEFLTNLLANIHYHERPLYIIMDELLVLCIDSKICKAIMDILAIGRHYNIFIIGISQLGTKEAVKFKDLFNARVCFRQVEESSYRAVLGYSPEERDLKKRQFLFYSDQIGSGYTYDVG